MRDPSPISLRVLFALACGIVVTLTAIAWRELGFPVTGLDDANIFFVYARNLSEGHGLVYNVGGEHVEGFSSPLWVLICALAFRIWPAPEFALTVISVMLTSTATACALIWLARDLAGEIGLPLRAAILAVFLCLLVTPGYIVWNTLTLMDVALWSALLLLATLTVVTDRPERTGWHSWRITALSALLIVTRPESFVMVPVLFAALFIARRATLGARSAVFSLALPLTMALATAVALTAFRLYYFGFPLPNTYYAKVSPSLFHNLWEGARYLRDFTWSGPAEALTVLAAVIGSVLSIAVVLRQGGWKHPVSALPCLALAGLIVPALTGGDHFRLFRAYQAVWPVLALNFFFVALVQGPEAMGLDPGRVREGVVTRQIVPIAGVLLVGVVLLRGATWRDQSKALGGDFYDAAEGRRLGEFLNVLFEDLPLPSVGMGAAGGIKMTYRGTVIDMLGLNNALVAHNGGERLGMAGHAAFEKRSFFELQPEVFLPGLWNRRARFAEIAFDLDESFKHLGDDPRFRSAYVNGQMITRKAGDESLVGYFRKDFLRAAETAGISFVESPPPTQ